MTNWICPASDPLESAVSPTLPSITTSAVVTAVLIRFCKAMGKARPNTIFKNSFICVILFLSVKLLKSKVRRFPV